MGIALNRAVAIWLLILLCSGCQPYPDYVAPIQDFRTDAVDFGTKRSLKLVAWSGDEQELFLVFNQPIHSLEEMNDPSPFEPEIRPLAFIKSVSRVGVSGIRIEFARALAQGRRYTATIPSGWRALSGASFGRESTVEWTVSPVAEEIDLDSKPAEQVEWVSEAGADRLAAGPGVLWTRGRLFQPSQPLDFLGAWWSEKGLPAVALVDSVGEAISVQPVISKAVGPFFQGQVTVPDRVGEYRLCFQSDAKKAGSLVGSTAFQVSSLAGESADEASLELSELEEGKYGGIYSWIGPGAHQVGLRARLESPSSTKDGLSGLRKLPLVLEKRVTTSGGAFSIRQWPDAPGRHQLVVEMFDQDNPACVIRRAVLDVGEEPDDPKMLAPNSPALKEPLSHRTLEHRLTRLDTVAVSKELEIEVPEECVLGVVWWAHQKGEAAETLTDFVQGGQPVSPLATTGPMRFEPRKAPTIPTPERAGNFVLKFLGTNAGGEILSCTQGIEVQKESRYGTLVPDWVRPGDRFAAGVRFWSGPEATPTGATAGASSESTLLPLGYRSTAALVESGSVGDLLFSYRVPDSGDSEIYLAWDLGVEGKSYKLETRLAPLASEQVPALNRPTAPKLYTMRQIESPDGQRVKADALVPGQDFLLTHYLVVPEEEVQGRMEVPIPGGGRIKGVWYRSRSDELIPLGWRVEEGAVGCDLPALVPGEHEVIVLMEAYAGGDYSWPGTEIREQLQVISSSAPGRVAIKQP
ncbi:MAG: hypothetical protein WC314_16685 [Vulcanimicrobiota bacterium]